MVIPVGSYNVSPCLPTGSLPTRHLLLPFKVLGDVQGSPFGVVPGAGLNVSPDLTTRILPAYTFATPVALLAFPRTKGGVLHAPAPPESIDATVAIAIPATLPPVTVYMCH